MTEIYDILVPREQFIFATKQSARCLRLHDMYDANIRPTLYVTTPLGG